MRTFKYWISECLDDAQCYSYVGRTKTELLARMRQLGHVPGVYPWGPMEQRKVDYDDLFEFFEILTSEGGGRTVGYTD